MPMSFFAINESTAALERRKDNQERAKIQPLMWASRIKMQKQRWLCCFEKNKNNKHHH